MIDLDELERLELEATPGPWAYPRMGSVERESDRAELAVGVTVPNGRLIAAARNALPVLIRELRAARACIEEIRRISGPTRTILAGVLDAYDAATKGES